MSDDSDNTNDLIDGVLDAGAEVLHEIQCDWDREKKFIQQQNREMQVDLDAALAPIRERVAALEGQVATLLSMLGGDGANSNSNSNSNSNRSKRAKQAPGNGHTRLLEHRPQ